MLTSVTETILVTRMQSVRTPLDHMYVNVSLDILEMDRIAEVNLIERTVDCALFCCEARKKRLDHERSVERNTRRSRVAFTPLLTFIWFF